MQFELSQAEIRTDAKSNASELKTTPIMPNDDGVPSGKLRTLLMTCQPLTKRMMLHSKWLTKLTAESETIVWSTGLENEKKLAEWTDTQCTAESFPEVRPYREFPFNYLRRFNEFVWDYRLQPPSRLSMLEHVRLERYTPSIKRLFRPAKLAAALGMGRPFEALLEKLLLLYGRSSDGRTRLNKIKPDVVITTDPFCYLEPAIIAEAKTLGIKTLGIITSWDNLSTKNRMVLRYDGYIVWSEQMRNDLHHFYPYTTDVPCYVVGAPQFDVFFEKQNWQSREEFCGGQGLDPDKRIVLYALGSPNFLQELPGAVEFEQKLAESDLNDVQLLVRPHPMFFDGTEQNQFGAFGKNVVVQKSGEGVPLTSQSQDKREIIDWINTFRHADVVINLSSTVAIDAAIFDKPVVNIDFDPEPGQPNQALIKDINHRWTHFKPIAESGGMWLVNDYDEMLSAVKAYLHNPELHREKRRWMAEFVCGNIDGKSGERMAEAIIDFTKKNTNPGAR
ncbi:MAG: CDP-glycerol glycerophosphotransferase family protein [Pyrinomonadaceae bacterium]